MPYTRKMKRKTVISLRHDDVMDLVRKAVMEKYGVETENDEYRILVTQGYEAGGHAGGRGRASTIDLIQIEIEDAE
jgi:NAD(P)H-dependent flavin oxidoreductase YrpB (nitropropane dioxygenase family)